jgi:phosphoribosylaminoimidazole-succinocarboxamide synthase
MVSPQKFPADFPGSLKERTIVVKRLKALPIEAIVR